ncbi:M16 family metallopeptidase [Undibacterium pigrum]|uniref:Zinc protease n=1 Tax=Undibacterium pigrum TaxID=401470 RepID=A0A318JBV7_9BURK|nr:insulinase family protein [Undibacterium pigrum]PXX45076.1 zinc protease [Undibacterium pigrum]
MLHIKTPVVAIALAVHLLFSRSHAQAATSLPANVEKLSTVEGISEYRLPNGLKVLLMPDNSKSTTTVNMTYLAGSRNEGAGQTGYAHLLEHMLCKGSKNYPEISRQLIEKGMRSNAFTFPDYTQYFATFEANESELNWVLSMEADRMLNARILKSELDTEMTVVRNELELRENNAYDTLMRRVQAVAFDWHGYGHSVIGEKSDIENVSIEQLQQLYRQYYRPDNAVLMVAGKFDASIALQTISRQFGTIPTPKSALPKIPTIEPAQQGERQVILRKKGNSNPVILAYHSPSLLHPDYTALQFAATMLTSGRELRSRTGDLLPVNEGLGFHTEGITDNGLILFGYSILAGSPDENSPKAVTKAIETFGNHAWTEQDLDLFKSKYVNIFSYIMNNPHALSMRISRYIAAGDWRLMFLEKDRVANMKTEQLQQAAQRYFVRENRTTGILLTEQKNVDSSMPAVPQVSDIMKDFSHVDEYAAVAEFNTSPENIQQSTRRIKIGNIETALLVKPTRGQEVVVELVLHWGDEKSLANKRWIDRLTRQVLLNGTSRYGKETLDAEREKARMRGGVTKFITDKSHLKQALKLMVLNLKEPSLAQATAAIMNERYSWQKAANTPERMAKDELARHFNSYPMGDIRALETSQQVISELNAIKATDLIDFHKQFYGASNGHLAIVGDFDIEEVKTVLEEEFKDWESKAAYQPAPFKFVDHGPLRKFLDTPGKENGYFLGQLDLPVGVNDADFIALNVASYLLGGHSVESRLGRRVRLKEGWSYGVTSSLSPYSSDAVSSWEITASAASSNIDKLQQAVLEEMQLVVANGFTRDELQAAKSALSRLKLQSRHNDDYLTTEWNALMHKGVDYSWQVRQDLALQNLSLEQLNQAVKKYLQPERWSIVTTGDASKIAKKQ